MSFRLVKYDGPLKNPTIKPAPGFTWEDGRNLLLRWATGTCQNCRRNYGSHHGLLCYDKSGYYEMESWYHSDIPGERMHESSVPFVTVHPILGELSL